VNSSSITCASRGTRRSAAPLRLVVSHDMSVKSLIGKVAIIAGVLFTLFIVAVGLLVYPIFRVNRPPAIKNPIQLVADCQMLVELKHKGKLTLEEKDPWTRGSIILEQWPVSLAELEPRGVYVLDDRVTILVSTGGIGPSFGYVIPYLKQTNFIILGRGRTKIGGSFVSKTEYTNVYSWTNIE